MITNVMYGTSRLALISFLFCLPFEGNEIFRLYLISTLNMIDVCEPFFRTNLIFFFVGNSSINLMLTIFFLGWNRCWNIIIWIDSTFIQMAMGVLLLWRSCTHLVHCFRKLSESVSSSSLAAFIIEIKFLNYF